LHRSDLRENQKGFHPTVRAQYADVRRNRLSNGEEQLVSQNGFVDPMVVWAGMKMKTWPERYFMLYLPIDQMEPISRLSSTIRGKYSCLILDQGGISVTVDEEIASHIERISTIRAKYGPFRIISTDGELPFNVIGFLWPLFKELNERWVKAGPQCAADFDHLFVYEEKLSEAERIIEAFITSAKKAVAAQ
jgi:hypothetical protein